MKEYKVLLDDRLASIYKEIAVLSDKEIEEILQDTLMKVIELIGRDK